MPNNFFSFWYSGSWFTQPSVIQKIQYIRPHFFLNQYQRGQDQIEMKEGIELKSKYAIKEEVEDEINDLSAFIPWDEIVTQYLRTKVTAELPSQETFSLCLCLSPKHENTRVSSILH